MAGFLKKAIEVFIKRIKETKSAPTTLISTRYHANGGLRAFEIQTDDSDVAEFAIRQSFDYAKSATPGSRFLYEVKQKQWKRTD